MQCWRPHSSLWEPRGGPLTQGRLLGESLTKLSPEGQKRSEQGLRRGKGLGGTDGRCVGAQPDGGAVPLSPGGLGRFLHRGGTGERPPHMTQGDTAC